MIKEFFTPDNCPLQVGAVVHHIETNKDYMVIARELDYSDCYDTNVDLPLILTAGDVNTWVTGKELAAHYEYYPDWPNLSETAPCYFEVEEPGISDTEFAQLVFDAAKKLPGVNKLYKTIEYDVSVWDNDAHAIIQESCVTIIDGLKALLHKKKVEEENK